MSQPQEKTAPEPEDLEEIYKRHCKIVPQVKQAYAEALKSIFADLHASNLDPFKAIMLEHENVEMNTKDLIETMRTQLTNSVSKLNKFFFEANEVDSKLITLEMLKEKFAAYEGSNWNVVSMPPEERTRPARMLYLNQSMRHMKKQLNAQQRELEAALALSRANRERIQNIHNERVKLRVLMQQQAKIYKAIKPEMVKMRHRLNELN